jgi:hypothetical protein
MLTILGELFTLLFLCVCGGKRAHRKVSGTLAENNRQLAALHAQYRTDAICFEREMAEWNEKVYPDYRKQLNQERTTLGLPPM